MERRASVLEFCAQLASIGDFVTPLGGFNFTPTFLNLLLEVGVERIMFSVDHPYVAMEEARGFLRHLPVTEAG